MAELLFAPSSERWVIRYTLAYAGLACVGAGCASGSRWLAVAGIGLCVPFALWFATFFGLVAPIALGWLLVARWRGRV